MSCSRCSSPLVTPEQFERGLCGMCLTTSSLSALVALAAESVPESLTHDRQWKATQFSNPTPEVM